MHIYCLSENECAFKVETKRRLIRVTAAEPVRTAGHCAGSDGTERRRRRSGVRAFVHCCVARGFGYEVTWTERCCGGIFTR